MMPACPRWRASTSSSWRFRFARAQDAIDEIRTIERADQLDRIAEPELRGDVAADARGRGRGVGVQADAGQQRRAARPSCRYSGRKSCPHWLMQCASSIATKLTWQLAEQVERNPSPPPRPAARATRTAAGIVPRAGRRAPSPSDRTPASCCSRPRRRRCRRACPPDPSSARSAATRPPPGRRGRRAGAWKQSDLPPPVGSTTIESRPARIASIASRWSGRNEV